MSRLIIVSNRLPVSFKRRANGLVMDASSGGVATGLGAYHASHDSLWVGWVGSSDGWSPRQWAAVEAQLEPRRFTAVNLSSEEFAGFYAGFSNEVLWPLCHYLLERIPLDSRHWEAYAAVNRRFADEVASVYRPGDLVWVNDYQLLLVPALLRAQRREARIAYFHHIPFPAFEVFRTLPWGRALLEGALGADVIGLHTDSYVQHLRTSLGRLLGVDGDHREVAWQGRRVQVRAYPMGIDVEHFGWLAADTHVCADAERIRAEAGGRTLLLGVDRLDYTKGIPRRLLAFERILRHDPSMRDRLRLVMVAVPSRGEVPSYRAYRSQTEALVGRINGEFGTVDAVPVHYLHTAVSPERLVALYRAANVLIVNPLRDGMNLVAKEFVAARTDEDGVLLLSEFAGASEELREAVSVNPYDIEGFADRILQAVTMSRAERRTRMRALRVRVLRNPVGTWAGRIVADLENVPALAETPQGQDEQVMADVAGRVAAAASVLVFVDYDGTLVPFTDVPDLATPDPGLLALLGQMVATPGLTVSIISGRPRETLEEWFKGTGLRLWAEHGLWYSVDGQDWAPTTDSDASALDSVVPKMEAAATETPGTHLERKGASVAWHYRVTDPDIGRERARALRESLVDATQGTGLAVVEGNKVVEVRPRGAHKGIAITSAAAAAPEGTLMLAIGDDVTDEDMFRALPDSGIAIVVGERPSNAHHRLGSWQAVRRLLSDIVAARVPAPSPAGDPAVDGSVR